MASRIRDAPGGRTLNKTMRPYFGKTFCGLTFAVLLGFTAAVGAQDSSAQFIQGRLGFEVGTGPVLEAAGKSVTLSSQNSYLFHTLGDVRLRNREVRLEGKKLADGSFQVERILTEHNGKLYRIRYYCETCNIEALQPGPCVCCQQPVELQEIPLDKNDKHVIVTK
jgi:hypothetical protein